MNSYNADKLQSERLKHFLNVNSLLKISLGLVLFTVISSALVYAETFSVDIEGNSFDVETMEEETVADTPKTECGPGTILKDDVCELDERCGPGTVLEDGVCVLDLTPKSSETSVKIDIRELIAGTVTALVIALIIMIILGIISKASKSKN